MEKLLILTEKDSAFKNYMQALGGDSGEINGYEFKLVKAQGHLMTFVEDPSQMVKDSKNEERYASWQLKDLGWNPNDLTWEKTYGVDRNGRSVKPLMDKIKKASAGMDAIVIATDSDPSGEGDLLAWEIINKIGWHKIVYRTRPVDEAPKSILKALKNMVDVSDQMAQGEYLKADARSKWDYLSMQLSRAATTAARNAGYDVRSAPQGRLKSVILTKTFKQELAYENYTKHPFWEVQYQDENGNIFKRSLTAEAKETERFANERVALQAMQKFQMATVGNVKTQTKTAEPGPLLTLSGLSVLLTKQGFTNRQVQDTYQSMYEAKIASYPRTEDKKITEEQYRELLPLANKIASVVGIDTQLLTHRTIRKKHLTESAAHGANRPGPNVPHSLEELKGYGPGAKEIYIALASNFLSILCEDYVFEETTANLAEYPAFKTSFNRPIKLNFKALVTDKERDTTDKKIGSSGMPFLHEGSNARPKRPNQDWIINFLESHNIGTGATQVDTLASLTDSKAKNREPLIDEKKGNYTLTRSGKVSAIMATDTWIGDAQSTKNLFAGMDQVGQKKIPPEKVIMSAQKLAQHDLPILAQNASKLNKYLGKPTRVHGAFIGGQDVSFKRIWGNHEFNDHEIQQLLAGRKITFSQKGKKGKSYKVTGQLGEAEYKGKKYWGFIREEQAKNLKPKR